MNDDCRKYRELLSLTLDSESGESAADSTHSGCPECEAFKRDILAIRKTLHSEREKPLPPELVSRILNQTSSSSGYFDFIEYFRHVFTSCNRIPRLIATFAIFIALIAFWFSSQKAPSAWLIETDGRTSPADSLISLQPANVVRLVTAAGSELLLWGGPAIINLSLQGDLNEAGHSIALASGKSCMSWESRKSEILAVNCEKITLNITGTRFRITLNEDKSILIEMAEGTIQISGSENSVSIDGFQKVAVTATGGIGEPAAFNPIADEELNGKCPIAIRMQ